MAVGVTDRLWDVADLVALWESYEQRRAERAAWVKRSLRLLALVSTTVFSLFFVGHICFLRFDYNYAHHRFPP